ncbi:hypothetical protein RJ639_035593 [Escallonia herrerae]|uniref:DUF2828 domain-containing protein n=1 Tax=Escallonia herrerae TaxID=1293975 RepID=A0AA88WPH6_9ASTE|nr:hypothetical protein RJ639_035593 [Escallonia herrerae]
MDLVLTVFVSDPSGPRLMPPPSPPSRPAPSSSRSTSPSPLSSSPSNHSTRGLPPSSNSASPSLPSSRPKAPGHLQSVIHKDGVCVRSTSDPRRSVQIWLIAVNRMASVAMHNYKEKFLKHDKERFEGYLEQVEAGMAKITASARLTHELKASLNDADDRQVVELQ